MRIVDAHAHIFPEKIARVATRAIGDFYGGFDMAYDGTANELLRSGGLVGVEKYLIFSTATTPAQVEKINDFILNECAVHDEFIPVGTMHRDYNNVENELERISACGAVGVKLHPDFQQFAFDDAKLSTLFAQMERLGMFVITHAGDPRSDFSHPERIANVALQFPKLRIIAAHLGGWNQWDIARKFLNLSNLWFDTSSVLEFAGAAPLLEALKVFDHRKIFFGVDFPMWDHRTELNALMATGVSERVLEDILFNNINEFLGGVL